MNIHNRLPTTVTRLYTLLIPEEMNPTITSTPTFNMSGDKITGVYNTQLSRSLFTQTKKRKHRTVHAPSTDNLIFNFYSPSISTRKKTRTLITIITSKKKKWLSETYNSGMVKTCQIRFSESSLFQHFNRTVNFLSWNKDEI